MKSPTAIILTLIVAVACNAFCQAAAQSAPAKSSLDWNKGVYTATADTKISRIAGRPNTALAVASARKRTVGQVLASVESTLITSFAQGRDLLKNPKVRQAAVGFIERKGKFSQQTITIGGIPVVRVSVEVPAVGLVHTMLALANKLHVATGSVAGLKVSVPANRLLILPKEAQKGPFSSVIVDATGLKLQRAMSPKIRRRDGSEVWGTVNVDPDFVLEKGIVAYCKTMDTARKNGRAGDNPLIIQALGIAGGKFYCDPVIEDDSATLLLDENRTLQFLDKFNVIFVLGE